MIIDPIAEVRRLAERALADCQEEQRVSHEALIRANMHLDKYHELLALAERIGAATFAAEHFEIITP